MTGRTCLVCARQLVKEFKLTKRTILLCPLCSHEITSLTMKSREAFEEKQRLYKIAEETSKPAFKRMWSYVMYQAHSIKGQLKEELK